MDVGVGAGHRTNAAATPAASRAAKDATMSPFMRLPPRTGLAESGLNRPSAHKPEKGHDDDSTVIVALPGRAPTARRGAAARRSQSALRASRTGHSRP
jgi:hypothetical protein